MHKGHFFFLLTSFFKYLGFEPYVVPVTSKKDDLQQQ